MQYKETHARSVMKGATWRITAMVDTLTIAWLVTGRISTALQIAGIETFTKIFLYYLHERVWGKIEWARAEKDTHLRSLAKGVSWRMMGSVDTTGISWLVTGQSGIALRIGGIEVLTKISLYYLHERIWASIGWGKASIAPAPPSSMIEGNVIESSPA